MMMPELRPREWTSGRPLLAIRAGVSSSMFALPDESKKGTRRPVEQGTAHGQTAPQIQAGVVLIAEDEETIAETLAMIVEDAGFVPVVAHDGREALALARQHRPQLIITDLMMPYLSGTDLIAAIRRDAATMSSAPPPVIVVTAASRARAEEAGADVIIEKPFNVTKVEAAMLRLLPPDRS